MAERARRGWRSRVDGASWSLACGGVLGLGVILLLAPTLIVLATSLNGGYALRFPPRDLSLRWYVALFTESEDLVDAALTSLAVSSSAVAVATVLATAAAMTLARERAAWARALEAFFLSPMMLPGVSLGLASLMWLSLLGMPLSFWTLVIGHVAIATPYILRTALIGLAQIDPALIDASRSLGARRWRTFRRITLPLAAPSIVAGAFIAFMFSFDNVPISLFLSDARTETLPIRLWNLIENLLDIRAAAVSGVIIVLTLILIAAMERLFGLGRYLR